MFFLRAETFHVYYLIHHCNPLLRQATKLCLCYQGAEGEKEAWISERGQGCAAAPRFKLGPFDSKLLDQKTMTIVIVFSQLLRMVESGGGGGGGGVKLTASCQGWEMIFASLVVNGW